MTADDVKGGLYARHPGSGGQMPGPWTVLEEWRGIDLLAISAWQSKGAYARVGYEVKVSRSDLRRELLNPWKRSGNVAWCNEFYLAVPAGLLTDAELAYREPDWQPDDFTAERCPGWGRRHCQRQRGHRGHVIRLPRPSTRSGYPVDVDVITCPTCGGKGILTASRVETEAPHLWVPRDVGLVIVDGRGTRVERRSPKRAEVPALNRGELGQFVRWISMRPDPRHHPRRTT